jgi:hypothetical protein
MTTNRVAQGFGTILPRVLVALALLGASPCEEGGEATILDLDPKVGPTQGDQPVKLVGQHFRQDIGYTVYFGTKRATSLTIFDPETILVTTPTGVPAGTVDVLVRADNGDAWRLPKAFEFKDMGGSVVEGLGVGAASKKKGNLAF